MAEIKPLKVAGTGNGNGELREFEAGDTLPASLVPELGSRVSKTSDTGAAFLPVGTEAQRPTTPINGLLRYNNETNQFEGYQNGKWGSIGGGDALFTPEWWPKRSSVPAGYVPADGQLLSRSTFPDAAAGIDAGLMPIVTETEWESDPLKRGSYTAGDGSTTFRLPDYNGASAGSLPPLFLRGGTGEGGVIQRDALQNITGSFGGDTTAFNAPDTEGAFGSIEVSPNYRTSLEVPPSGFGRQVDFDASRVARTADETRSINVGGVWVIKLFGAVVNEGLADAAQLATDVASLSGRVSTVEGEKPLGWGQTWQDVSGSRTINVTYINSTERPIVVSVNMTASEGFGISGLVDGELAVQSATSAANGFGVSVIFPVPVGSTYSITRSAQSTGALLVWRELR